MTCFSAFHVSFTIDIWRPDSFWRPESKVNALISFLRVRSAERNFFRTDLYFKLRIKHCSVHVCVSEDCFELLVWIFWTSFFKFSKMFKLQTAESLTTTSRMANFKNTEGEKKSNDDDTFYISRDKCLRHSCAYFLGGQPCIIWPKQPKDPKKQHHLALTWCLVF